MDWDIPTTSPIEDIKAAVDAIRRRDGFVEPDRIIVAPTELARIIEDCDAEGIPVPDELRAIVAERRE